MRHADLEMCGVAMYGEHWMGRMADDLGISDRSLRRFANGSVDIPEGVWSDLADIASRRRSEIDEILAVLLPKLPNDAI